MTSRHAQTLPKHSQAAFFFDFKMSDLLLILSYGQNVIEFYYSDLLFLFVRLSLEMWVGMAWHV